MVSPRTRRALLGTLGGSLGALSGCARFTTPRGPSRPATVSGEPDRRLGFAGDTMLGRGVDERWHDGPPAGVWGDLGDRLDTLDGLFLNLECCLSDRGSPRPGRTYHFRADPDWAVPALSAGGVAWASLANNHVLDFGPEALADTTDALTGGGIAHAGAGDDLAAALTPSLLAVEGVEVAVVAFTDRSASYGAGATAPGTAYVRFDATLPRTRRLVGRALDRARAGQPDLVVASLHWGPNWEVRPSGTQRRFARWLVDRGVDLVHGHSAHVLQGVEVHRGRPIVYDAGDLVDDYAVKPDLHNDRSALFELVIEDGVVRALDVVPVAIVDERATLATGDVARWVRERLRTLSAPFDTPTVRAGTGLRIPLDQD